MNPAVTWLQRAGRRVHTWELGTTLSQWVYTPGGYASDHVTATPLADGSLALKIGCDGFELPHHRAAAHGGLLWQWVSTGERQGRLNVYEDLFHAPVIAAPEEGE